MTSFRPRWPAIRKHFHSSFTISASGATLMTLFQSLILGIVQGLTEFIPVSSTAHLILVPWLLGWTFNPTAAFAFNVLVQLGTLAAVVVYFWKDLWQMAVAVIQGLVQQKPFAST